MFGRNTFSDPGNINPKDPLWLLIPQLLLSIILSSLIVVGVFWLYFGVISTFSLGFALFLSLMQVLMVVGYRFQDRPDFQILKSAKWGTLDKIGGFWLVACAFGAFLAWICGQLAIVLPEIGSAMYIGAAIFAIGFPVLTVLPNLRYVGGRASYIQIPLVVFVTALPVLEGVYYLLRVSHPPLRMIPFWK